MLSKKNTKIDNKLSVKSNWEDLRTATPINLRSMPAVSVLYSAMLTYLNPRQKKPSKKRNSSWPLSRSKLPPISHLVSLLKALAKSNAKMRKTKLANRENATRRKAPKLNLLVISLLLNWTPLWCLAALDSHHQWRRMSWKASLNKSQKSARPWLLRAASSRWKQKPSYLKTTSC